MDVSFGCPAPFSPLQMGSPTSLGSRVGAALQAQPEPKKMGQPRGNETQGQMSALAHGPQARLAGADVQDVQDGVQNV